MSTLAPHRGEFNSSIMSKDIASRNISLSLVAKVKSINFFSKSINISNKFMKRYELSIAGSSSPRHVRPLFLRSFKKAKKHTRRPVNFYVNIDLIDNVNFYIGM